MPDFEALIRDQQLKQPTANQRLKVVDSHNYGKKKNEQPEISNPRIINNFFISFLGSVIGTLGMFFLYINEYLPMDFLKIK